MQPRNTSHNQGQTSLGRRNRIDFNGGLWVGGTESRKDQVWGGMEDRVLGESTGIEDKVET